MNSRSPSLRDRLTQGVALVLVLTVFIGIFFVIVNRTTDDRIIALPGPHPAWVGTRDAADEWRWTDAGLLGVPLQFALEGIPPDAIVRLDIPVELPGPGEPYAILLKRVMNAAELRWDGEIIGEFGSVWEDSPGASRALFLVNIPQRAPLGDEPDSAHVLTLYLRGTHGVGGLAGDLVVGPAEALRDQSTRDIAQRVFLGALLAMGALAALAMAALRPGERAFFWFGLVNGTAALRLSLSGLTGPTALSPLATVRLSYALTGVIMAAGLLFVAFYVGRPKVTAVRVVAAASWVLTVAALALPDTAVVGPLLIVFKAFTPLIGLLAIGLLVDGWRRRVYGTEAIGLSVLFLVAAGTQNTLLGRLGWDYSGTITLGYVGFTLTAITAMILRNIDAQSIYEELVAGAPDAILVVEAAGRVIQANEAARQLMPALAESQTLTSSVIYEDQETLRHHLLRADPRQRVELRALGDDGELRWVESVATPLEEGRLLIVMRDTTHRRGVERSLIHAARLETAGILASGIAHDVNNALGALMGHIELLRESSDAAVRRRVERMDTVIRRTAAMTRRLLTAVRGGTGAQVTVDPAQPARDAVELVASMLPSHIQVALHTEGQLPDVRAVAAEIEQALLNLLLNARDAMSETGGTIQVNVSSIETPRGPGVRYVVEDQGPGVPAHLRSRIWEPFYTTKGEGRGTGLGLSVVARVAREHGGTVQVLESHAGARFALDLPMDNASQTQSGVFLRTGLRVLVVDDDADIRDLMCAELQARGSEAVPAASGEQALELFHTRPDFDLLVTDVVMPGLSGVKLAERLLALKPSLPVLIVSGFIPVSEAEIRPEWGRLNKPFSAVELTTAVRRTMVRANQSRETPQSTGR